MKTIVYLGPEQTNTHVAAQAAFGRQSRYIHEPTVDDVFTLVERDQADYGVVPIENSLEGAVTHTLDRFIDFKDSPVKIVGEIEFVIRHYCITQPGVALRDVEAVYSHPQALAQCRPWITTHLPKRVTRVETNSTAEAVEYIAHQGAPRATARVTPMAAIGRREAAAPYRLIATPIPDDRENKTRFLVLGKRPSRTTARHKTSILFALKDRPGALYDALTPFKREGINLTKIESRPSKRKAWEYLFFIDMAGHAADPRVKRAIRALERTTAFLRILGSYPTVRRASRSFDSPASRRGRSGFRPTGERKGTTGSARGAP